MNFIFILKLYPRENRQLYHNLKSVVSVLICLLMSLPTRSYSAVVLTKTMNPSRLEGIPPFPMVPNVSTTTQGPGLTTFSSVKAFNLSSPGVVGKVYSSDRHFVTTRNPPKIRDGFRRAKFFYLETTGGAKFVFAIYHKKQYTRIPDENGQYCDTIQYTEEERKNLFEAGPSIAESTNVSTSINHDLSIIPPGFAENTDIQDPYPGIPHVYYSCYDLALSSVVEHQTLVLHSPTFSHLNNTWLDAHEIQGLPECSWIEATKLTDRFRIYCREVSTKDLVVKYIKLDGSDFEATDISAQGFSQEKISLHQVMSEKLTMARHAPSVVATSRTSGRHQTLMQIRNNTFVNNFWADFALGIADTKNVRVVESDSLYIISAREKIAIFPLEGDINENTDGYEAKPLGIQPASWLEQNGEFVTANDLTLFETGGKKYLVSAHNVLKYVADDSTHLGEFPTQQSDKVRSRNGPGYCQLPTTPHIDTIGTYSSKIVIHHAEFDDEQFINEHSLNFANPQYIQTQNTKMYYWGDYLRCEMNAKGIDKWRVQEPVGRTQPRFVHYDDRLFIIFKDAEQVLYSGELALDSSGILKINTVGKIKMTKSDGTIIDVSTADHRTIRHKGGDTYHFPSGFKVDERNKKSREFALSDSRTAIIDGVGPSGGLMMSSRNIGMTKSNATMDQFYRYDSSGSKFCFNLYRTRDNNFLVRTDGICSDSVSSTDDQVEATQEIDSTQ